jgi:hypothetical protein
MCCWIKQLLKFKCALSAVTAVVLHCLCFLMLCIGTVGIQPTVGMGSRIANVSVHRKHATLVFFS